MSGLGAITSTTKHAVRPRSTPLALARAYSTGPGASGTVTRTHCTAARSRASGPLAESPSPSQKGAATAGGVTRTPASGRWCWATQSRTRRPAAAGLHERRGRGGDCPQCSDGDVLISAGRPRLPAPLQSGGRAHRKPQLPLGGSLPRRDWELRVTRTVRMGPCPLAAGRPRNRPDSETASLIGARDLPTRPFYRSILECQCARLGPETAHARSARWSRIYRQLGHSAATTDRDSPEALKQHAVDLLAEVALIRLERFLDFGLCALDVPAQTRRSCKSLSAQVWVASVAAPRQSRRRCGRAVLTVRSS